MQSLTANPARLVAAIAAVAVLAGGMLVFKMTSSGSGSSSSTTTPQLLHASAKSAHKPATSGMKHVARAPKRLHAMPVHRTAVAPSGLPWAVQDALVHNSVVVVAVVTPKAPVDDLTLAEAKAGAKSGKAGFVRVNAYSQKQIGPFDSVITVNANPAILVMRGPKAVTIQVPGYADRQSVVQAIDDARILKLAAAAN